MNKDFNHIESAKEYSVLNPCGTRQVLEKIPLSPRLNTLEGKVVYFVEVSGRPLYMQELTSRLKNRVPGVRTVFRLKPHGPMTDDPETWDEVVDKADALVCGTCMGASSGAFGVGWVAGVENCGIPSVYTVADFYDAYVRFSAEMMDIPALRTVKVNLVPEDEILTAVTDSQYDRIISDIIDALTIPLNTEELKAGKTEPPLQPRISMTGTLDEVQKFFHDKRYTDGLPIIPPTEEKVLEMLKGTSHSPHETVKAEFQKQISTNSFTVEKVAIVGAMAGCKPEYMPVLLAISEALGKSSAGQASPSSFSLLTLVNGPIRNEIGMNAGMNSMGPGNQANASIGRFVRLALINLVGLIPGLNDMSGQGNPTRYSFCIPENEEESPWEPFHVSIGYKTDESIISIFTGGHTYSSVISLAPKKTLMEQLTASRTGPLYLMNPSMARLYSEQGMSKTDVEDHIFENALMPMSEVKREGLTWGRPFYDNKMPDEKLVPMYDRKNIKLLLVGGECGQPTAQVWQFLMPSVANIDNWR